MTTLIYMLICTRRCLALCFRTQHKPNSPTWLLVFILLCGFQENSEERPVSVNKQRLGAMGDRPARPSLIEQVLNQKRLVGHNYDASSIIFIRTNEPSEQFVWLVVCFVWLSYSSNHSIKRVEATPGKCPNHFDTIFVHFSCCLFGFLICGYLDMAIIQK